MMAAGNTATRRQDPTLNGSLPSWFTASRTSRPMRPHVQSRTFLPGVTRGAEGPAQYDHFVERSPRLDVRRVAPLPEVERAMFGSQFAAHLGRGSQTKQGKPAPTPIDLWFTAGEIAQYEAVLDPPSLESLCLSAERIGQSTRQRTPVDVYETDRAALSRLERGLLRIFGELYQLFFHLSSLGRNTAELGAAVLWAVFGLLAGGADIPRVTAAVRALDQEADRRFPSQRTAWSGPVSVASASADVRRHGDRLRRRRLTRVQV